MKTQFSKLAKKDLSAAVAAIHAGRRYLAPYPPAAYSPPQTTRGTPFVVVKSMIGGQP